MSLVFFCFIVSIIFLLIIYFHFCSRFFPTLPFLSKVGVVRLTYPLPSPPPLLHLHHPNESPPTTTTFLLSSSTSHNFQLFPTFSVSYPSRHSQTLVNTYSAAFLLFPGPSSLPPPLSLPTLSLPLSLYLCFFLNYYLH